MPNISDREFERLKNAVEELTTLNQIASAINVTMKVDAITQSILDHCVKRLGAAQGAVFLLDELQNEADNFKTFVREFDPKAAQIPFRLNMSLTGWMVKNRTVLVSNDPDTDERFRGMNFVQMGITSVLAAPLMTRKGLVGLLVLFNKKDPAGFTDNDKRLLGIVGTQTAQVIENARLFEKEKELRAIEKELHVAETIQKGFLPKQDFSSKAVEIVGRNISAKEVGGDYYDIIELDDHRTFISLGDVSGKGVPAALLMANAQAVMRSQVTHGAAIDLSDVATRLNQVICQFASPGQFITALFGIVDCTKMTFSYVNAGHMPPVLVRKDGSVEVPGEAGLVIGVLPDFHFEAHEVDLRDCAVMVVYTDGVSEAMSEQEELYGDQRFFDFVQKHAQSAAAQIAEAAVAELTAYRKARAQSDDITMVVVKFP
jgi:sigma-B regulation protein RsbU (phosphoserine phosphatase)